MVVEEQDGKRKRMRRNRDQWQLVLSRYESVGLSVAAFCARESISEASLYRLSGLLSTYRTRVLEKLELNNNTDITRYVLKQKAGQ